MGHPLRVYLDQKDFGRIADALCRGDQTSPDVIAYERLGRLVAAGRARVFFSFVHVVEALRFSDVRSALAVAYCEVVDRLTEGHCIRFASHLQRAELALALGELFGFDSGYSKDSYAYGRYAEGLTPDGLRLDYESIGLSSDSAFKQLEEIREGFRHLFPDRQSLLAFLNRVPPAVSSQTDELLPEGTSTVRFLEILLMGSEAQRRQLAVSVFTNAGFVERSMRQCPDDAIERLNAEFPAGSFRWTRELLAAAVVGAPSERSQVWERFLNGAMNFKQLVGHYSLTQPDLAGMGTLFDGSSWELTRQLGVMQRFEPLRVAFLGTRATWDREIANDIGSKWIESLKADITLCADKHGFSASMAERELQTDGLRRLPYVRATTMWVHSYLARHKGTKFSRTPDENDLRDLLHCVNAPYVDVLVTDRFAAEVSRPLAQAFNTRIVRSLADLGSVLDTIS